MYEVNKRNLKLVLLCEFDDSNSHFHLYESCQIWLPSITGVISHDNLNYCGH